MYNVGDGSGGRKERMKLWGGRFGKATDGLVDDFQTTFLSKMRAFHVKDVLEPLAAGVMNEGIAAVIEKEAASIVTGLL